MRALWCVRPTLKTHTGGDTTQIERTADAMRRLGVDIKVDPGGRTSPEGFDIVHLWHLDRPWENLLWAKRAAQASVPIVLSTIWWPQHEFNTHGRAGVQRLIARAAGARLYNDARLLQRSAAAVVSHRLRAGDPARFTLRFRAAARKLLSHAAVILPNSPDETDQLGREFGTLPPVQIVPNAADTETFSPGPEPRDPHRVLCVGRIEPRKNQLTLVRALRDTPLTLEIIGAGGRFSGGYAEAVRGEANRNTVFTDHLRPEDLRRKFCTAAVHVCCSWYETPGLVGLEAGLCGCRVVTTDRGSGRWYFEDEAEYCDPSNPRSVRDAVLRALARPENNRLGQRTRERFTWDHAARATLQGYEYARRMT